MHTFDLNLGEIAKIEGKASLKVVVKDDQIEQLRFSITEFKRFYTQALVGKDVAAVPQLTARICGTCSNAHLLCAVKALEQALEIKSSPQTDLIRLLLNYGLIIRDHALHLYLFALPDILGVDSLLDLDENNPEQHQILHDAFELKAAGNQLGKVMGGRSVHAPYITLGGFTALPDQNKFPELIRILQSARRASLRAIALFQNCRFTLNRTVKFVSLKSPQFNFLNGTVITSDGETLSEKAYGEALTRIAIPYSEASGYQLKATSYMVGALARLNLGRDNLHGRTQKDAADALGLFPSTNIYHNNLAQAIEILHAIDSALDILSTLVIKPDSPVPFTRKKGTGIGLIEAPRGILFYKLSIDEAGKITTVRIVVPTGQNQVSIEQSIYDYLSSHLSDDKNRLIQEMEQLIRAYDPCMSCASHFLKVSWKTKRTKR